MPAGQPQFPTLEEKVDADNRSIYVGQVKKNIIFTKGRGTMRVLSEIQTLSNIHFSLHCRQPVATLSIMIGQRSDRKLTMCQCLDGQFSVGSLAERCTFGISLGILSYKYTFY